MAFDPMKSSYKENELRKKYHNYFVPAAKILVGDSWEDLLADHKVQIEGIRVSLSLKEASFASFTVTDVYDLGKHCLKDSVEKALALGTMVKVKLGYESELEEVFCGFIYERQVQFGDIPSITVTAMDVRRLMSENCRENYAWQADKKYSEIFEEIMTDYSGLKLSVETDADAIERSTPLIQQGNDLAMVKQLCRLANREFLVYGSSVYFKEKDESKTAITALLWGQELISFSPAPGYVDVEIEVWGNLKGSSVKQVEKRTVAAQTSMNHVMQKSCSRKIVLTDIDSIEELKARADKEEASLKGRVTSASGSCMGTPVLIPGRHVEIKNLETGIDGSYYLESVNHSFGTDGFTTDFTTGTAESNLYEEILEGRKEEDEFPKTAGIMKGQVVENWDDEHPGMVRVELLMGEDQSNDLGWVAVLSPYAGSEYGTYLLPEIGAQVLLAFDMGQLKSPYVIGCLWNQDDPLPKDTAKEGNTVKTVLTKGGNRIAVSDEEGKEKITVMTKGELVIELDDEKQAISIRDKDGENGLQINEKEGTVTIAAKKQAVLKINGQEMLTLDGNSKQASISADQISAEAGQKLNLKGQNVSLEGSSTDISGQSIKLEAQASLALKGSASVKAESSGMMELKGAMVKLN